MGITLGVLAIIVYGILVVVAAIRPATSPYSLAELKRRSKQSAASGRLYEQQVLLPNILTIVRVKSTILLIITVFLVLAAFGPYVGGVLAILAAISYPVLARARLARKLGASLYKVLEPRYALLIGKFPRFVHSLRDTPVHDVAAHSQIGSREELSELIGRSKDATTSNQRKAIMALLDFPDAPVSSIMTARKDIRFLEKSDFLGPLVLNDLHAEGFSRLPVIDTDLDHVVGIVYLRDLLSLDVRKSPTAEKVMDKNVLFIAEDATLEQALRSFLKHRQHLHIVVDATDQTVGLISLEDVMEALLGRDILHDADAS